MQQQQHTCLDLEVQQQHTHIHCKPARHSMHHSTDSQDHFLPVKYIKRKSTLHNREWEQIITMARISLKGS